MLAPRRNSGEPPRLALFVPSLEGGGAQRVMVNLAQGFAERGLRVDLILARAEGPYLTDVPPEVRVVDLAAHRVLASVPGLIRYLRRERPGWLLSALDHANVAALWAGRLAGAPIRIALGVHNCAPTSAGNRWIRSAVRLSYPWASDIIAVSEAVADNLSRTRGLRRDRISVIYNPVNIKEIRNKASAPLEHPWFSPSSAPVILSTGRLTKQKDFPTLIRAFRRLRKHAPARLLILGEGEERPRLEALIGDLGLQDHIMLPGFAPNPFAYMARASVFALSSASEGFGNVLVEAMACGCPVVATSCPGGPREILRDGKYGPLVPVGDSALMAAHLRAALDNPPPADTMRARAADFSADLIISKYLSLLLQRPTPTATSITGTPQC